MTDTFHFKQFSVNQQGCSMKVGTDSILLGSWANIEEDDRILDIGTGTGLLALMAAQRNPYAIIDAIEIDAASVRIATINFAQSPWAHRLCAHQVSLQKFKPAFQYQHIITNPPFFSDGPISLRRNRSNARHTESLSYQELIQSTKSLLAPTAKLHLILPASLATTFLKLAEQHDLYPTNITKVYPYTGKPAIRWLLSLANKKSILKESSLYIYDFNSSVYSQGFQKLTKAFYLYM